MRYGIHWEGAKSLICVMGFDGNRAKVGTWDKKCQALPQFASIILPLPQFYLPNR